MERLVDKLNRAYYGYHEGLGFIPNEAGLIELVKLAADEIEWLEEHALRLRREIASDRQLP